jgi:hypothetical protein
MARMHRTQIHLGDEEIRLLELESEATGASRAELIRRAILDRYGSGATASRSRPSFIGSVSSGRIDALEAKDWVRREWDKRWPPGEEQTG